MAEVASAYVSLIPSLRGGARAITNQTDAAARTAGKRFGGIFSGSVKSIIGGALAGAGVTKFLSDSLGEAREAQKATALTNQVIKSTGGVANVTAKHVGDLATAISNKIGVDDEAIQSGENLLLTFKNVRNEAGKGNDIFDQATHSLVNLAAGMAAASGGELNFRTSTTLVGKALNDPVKGLTALARVGVTFTKGQQDQIKALVKSGDRMKAQKIILRELKSEFGGAAKSQSTDADRARVAIGNLEEQIGTALLPVVDDLARKVTKDVVPAVSKFITQMQDGTGAGGEFVDVLQDTVGVGKDILSFFNGLPGPVKKYGAELLIASIALNKVNAGMAAIRASSFVSSITGAATSMRGLKTDLLLVSAAEGQIGPVTKDVADAQGRLAKRSDALGGAIRNLAGAGGMLALVDGTKRGDSALGALEVTAGAAATGFAVGGPLGAGIGAAAGGLFSLYKAATDSGKAAKTTLPTWKQYADTLDGVGAATSRATRELVLEQLTKEGTLKQTRELNISDRDAIQAALGNEAARKRVTAALAKNTEAGHNYQSLNIANRLGVETTAIYNSRVAQLKKNLALAATKEEAQKIQAKLDRLARTNATARISIGGADTAIQKLNAVLQLMHEITSSRGGTHGKTGGIGSLLTPRFAGATGAIVTRPTIALLGEAGAERVEPLNTAPGASPLPSAGSAIDQEQIAYRAFSRALANTGVVVMSRRNLDELDLLVGAG